MFSSGRKILNILFLILTRFRSVSWLMKEKYICFKPDIHGESLRTTIQGLYMVLTFKPKKTNSKKLP
jgi:hypothetical protein